jgi:hypothetical protein
MNKASFIVLTMWLDFLSRTARARNANTFAALGQRLSDHEHALRA